MATSPATILAILLSSGESLFNSVCSDCSNSGFGGIVKPDSRSVRTLLSISIIISTLINEWRHYTWSLFLMLELNQRNYVYHYQIFEHNRTLICSIINFRLGFAKVTAHITDFPGFLLR